MKEIRPTKEKMVYCENCGDMTLHTVETTIDRSNPLNKWTWRYNCTACKDWYETIKMLP